MKKQDPKTQSTQTTETTPSKDALRKEVLRVTSHVRAGLKADQGGSDV